MKNNKRPTFDEVVAHIEAITNEFEAAFPAVKGNLNAHWKEFGDWLKANKTPEDFAFFNKMRSF